jgi:hypothetical protein
MYKTVRPKAPGNVQNEDLRSQAQKDDLSGKTKTKDGQGDRDHEVLGMGSFGEYKLFRN